MATKFKNLTQARPELTVHTRRSTTIDRAEVRYVDGSVETFVLDEHGRFRLSAITCGEARRLSEAGAR